MIGRKHQSHSKPPALVVMFLEVKEEEEEEEEKEKEQEEEGVGGGSCLTNFLSGVAAIQSTSPSL